ncbi:MAG: TIGR03905 family TSCPD domain-containing protein [Erysipelotrichia bacterium]|nr:TIGR03905 family TSCPD domain-containing protein [Erysipelotrichia bacterium]
MSEKFIYHTKGTCSTEMIFIMDENKIENLEVVSGCNGNLKGIASLIKGHTAEEIIPLLQGIRCGSKMTSCPDQIAAALSQYLSERK